jgi:hypothetical protein
MRGPMPQIFYFIIFFPYKVPSSTFQNRFYPVMTFAFGALVPSYLGNVKKDKQYNGGQYTTQTYKD